MIVWDVVIGTECFDIFLLRDAMLARYMLSSCVRPSVRQSRYCVETTGRIGLVLARRLPATYATLSHKEIWVFRKIRALPPGTLSQTLDLENFATASGCCCQRNSSKVEVVDDTTMVDAALYKLLGS